MRRSVAAVAAAILLGAGLAGTASAAKGPPTNPPPPRQAGEAAFEAWADEYIVEDGFTLSGFTDRSAILFDPASVSVQDGYVSAIVRGEMFRTERILGVAQRSFRDRWLFDCAAKTSKEVSSEGYPQSNLQGRPAQVDVSKVDWAPLAEGGGEGRLMAQVCSLGSLLREGVDRAKAMPPDLQGVTDETTAAWMRQHVDHGKDVMAWAGKGVGAFYNPGEVAKAESGRPLLWLRTELSVLLPAEKTMWRSMRDQLELDCLDQRYLRLQQEVYPGSNLLGAKTQESLEPEWVEAAVGTTDAAWLGAVCRLLDGKPATAPPPPAPASGEPAAVVDWVEAYINTNGYVPATTTASGVLFYGVRDLQLGPGGHVLGTLRFEAFGAASAPTETVRSLRQAVELDCKGARQRILSATAYAANNLEGASAPSAPRAWEKVPAGGVGERILKEICSQISLFELDTALAMPTPLRGSTDAALEAWIDDHVVTGDYVISGYSDNAAFLYSAKEIERTRQDYIRVWTRLEFVRPEPEDGRVMRSMRMLVEFDCDEHRSRTLATEVFPGSNLTGAKSEEKKSQAEWSFIAPGAALSYVAGDVCQLKDEADEEAADPAKALPSSSGRQAL